MEKTFTIGQWEYDINSNNGFNVYLKDSLKTIALVLKKDVSYMPNELEAESNAKLIAAAPDLLEALQNIIATNGNICINDKEWINAEKAIEKALK